MTDYKDYSPKNSFYRGSIPDGSQKRWARDNGDSLRRNLNIQNGVNGHGGSKRKENPDGSSTITRILANGYEEREFIPRPEEPEERNPCAFVFEYADGVQVRAIPRLNDDNQIIDWTAESTADNLEYGDITFFPKVGTPISWKGYRESRYFSTTLVDPYYYRDGSILSIGPAIDAHANSSFCGAFPSNGLYVDPVMGTTAFKEKLPADSGLDGWTGSGIPPSSELVDYHIACNYNGTDGVAIVYISTGEYAGATTSNPFSLTNPTGWKEIGRIVPPLLVSEGWYVAWSMTDLVQATGANHISPHPSENKFLLTFCNLYHEFPASCVEVTVNADHSIDVETIWVNDFVYIECDVTKKVISNGEIYKTQDCLGDTNQPQTQFGSSWDVIQEFSYHYYDDAYYYLKADGDKAIEGYSSVPPNGRPEIVNEKGSQLAEYYIASDYQNGIIKHIKSKANLFSLGFSYKNIFGGTVDNVDGGDLLTLRVRQNPENDGITNCNDYYDAPPNAESPYAHHKSYFVDFEAEDQPFTVSIDFAGTEFDCRRFYSMAFDKGLKELAIYPYYPKDGTDAFPFTSDPRVLTNSEDAHCIITYKERTAPYAEDYLSNDWIPSNDFNGYSVETKCEINAKHYEGLQHINTRLKVMDIRNNMNLCQESQALWHLEARAQAGSQGWESHGGFVCGFQKFNTAFTHGTLYELNEANQIMPVCHGQGGDMEHTTMSLTYKDWGTWEDPRYTYVEPADYKYSHAYLAGGYGYNEYYINGSLYRYPNNPSTPNLFGYYDVAGKFATEPPGEQYNYTYNTYLDFYSASNYFFSYQAIQDNTLSVSINCNGDVAMVGSTEHNYHTDNDGDSYVEIYFLSDFDSKGIAAFYLGKDPATVDANDARYIRTLLDGTYDPDFDSALVKVGVI